MKEETIKNLKALQYQGDTEALHGDADRYLCEFLVSLGYKDVVDEWEKVDKWYA